MMRRVRFHQKLEPELIRLVLLAWGKWDHGVGYIGSIRRACEGRGDTCIFQYDERSMSRIHELKEITLAIEESFGIGRK